VIKVSGRIVSDGELSGGTIILRVGGKIGEVSGITIRVPPSWDYSSCLESTLSGILQKDTRQHPQLDDLFVGLVGARITLLKINPNNVILECGSIRIEKRLNPNDAFLVTDHDRKVHYKFDQALVRGGASLKYGLSVKMRLADQFVEPFSCPTPA
jgi:hypothetical protein